MATGIAIKNYNGPAIRSSGSSGSSSSSSSSVTTPTFAAGGEQVLEQLMAQLLGGGTAEQKRQQQERNAEITNVRDIRQDYTKDAAFADAEGAVAQQQRKALEELIPQLTRAAEGAGTSQSSMRALLTQDAANRAAESSAALGLKAAVEYGGISGNLSNTLEALTRPNNTVVDSLVQALSLTKGQETKTTSTGSGSGSGSGSSGAIRSSGTSIRDNPALYSFGVPNLGYSEGQDYIADMMHHISTGGRPSDFSFRP